MRILEASEVEQVSGGGARHWDDRASIHRAEPGSKVVVESLPGNRTGWCRGYGNLKDGQPKHQGLLEHCGGVELS